MQGPWESEHATLPGAYVMGVVARSRQASDHLAALVILNAGVTPQKKSEREGDKARLSLNACLPRFALLAAKAPKFVKSWEMLAAEPGDIR
jgi:hypothetical protein